MRYLKKTTDSHVLSSAWKYPGDAKAIRTELVREQAGYCAYSERYIWNTDSCDVEHFDPRLKSTTEDGYWNWYAVLHWMNSHKPRRMEPFLPILEPHSSQVRERVKYDFGQFVEVNDGDVEARNLIRYLGWNKPELAADRAKHVQRVRDLQTFFESDEAFLQYLRNDPDSMSFITALEAEIGLQIAPT